MYGQYNGIDPIQPGLIQFCLRLNGKLYTCDILKSVSNFRVVPVGTLLYLYSPSNNSMKSNGGRRVMHGTVMNKRWFDSIKSTCVCEYIHINGMTVASW